MPTRRGLLAPQNNFLDTIATRFDGTHSNFVLGNAQVPKFYPIVYCSDGFCELTGFPRAQIMQKSCACKFLYGAETIDENKKAIEKSLENKSELKIEVLFYKKSGTPFWCLLDLVPIKNEKREVVLFLASHKDITHSKMAEMSSFTSLENDENENLDPEAPPANYERRRSRAVLYQLSGHYKQENMKSKLKLNNNILQPHSAAPLPEYKTASIKKSRFILTHYGMFKTCWDLIILLATLYVAVTVPFNAAFRQDRPSMVLDIIVEALLIVDIFLNFRTTYINQRGELVLCPKLIAINYLRGWLIFDLLAAMPFDMLFYKNNFNVETHHIYLFKLTRLLRLLRFFQKLERYSQYSWLILCLLMLSFSLVAHWLACVWHAIARYEMSIETDTYINVTSVIRGELREGWVFELAERFGVEDPSDVGRWERYITALYFTCSSLTSVGFGNVSANTKIEKIFAVFIMLIGALMHATVFGNVTSIIQRMYLRRSLYQTKWRDLKDFLKLNRIPEELRHRMQDYFQTMWSLNQGIDIHETLKEFPEELRGDISMHIHREILSLPIFENASQGVLKLLSLHIRNNFCAPGEYLLHKGDAVQYIYYLCNGSMEVVMDEMVVAILGKGDLVGSDIDANLQITPDSVVKSSCDVKALTYCDLKSINISGLVDVLKLYPEYQSEFAHDIKHDLTHNIREGYDNEDKEMDVDMISGNKLLPSISEDDEEKKSDDDVSGGSTSPRSPMPPRTPNRFNFSRKNEEENNPSHRWCNQRNRTKNDRLRPLSPTRFHKSTDELRLEEQNARAHFEKLDNHVNTLHSDVNLLTTEVRSALQVLQNCTEDALRRRRRASTFEGNISKKSLALSEVVCHGGMSYAKSSPSIFQRQISEDDEMIPILSVNPPSINRFSASPLSPTTSVNSWQRRSISRHVSTQTNFPINVPVAVLEAFVLAHRERVLRLLDLSESVLQGNSTVSNNNNPYTCTYPSNNNNDNANRNNNNNNNSFCDHSPSDVFSFRVKKRASASTSGSSINSGTEYVQIQGTFTDSPNSSSSSLVSMESTQCKGSPTEKSFLLGENYCKKKKNPEDRCSKNRNVDYRPKKVSIKELTVESEKCKFSQKHIKKHRSKGEKNVLSTTYQLSDLHKWNPQPKTAIKTSMSQSLSEGSIRESITPNIDEISEKSPKFYRNSVNASVQPQDFFSETCKPLQLHPVPKIEIDENFTNVESKKFPNIENKNSSKLIGRSTSMPTNSFKFVPVFPSLIAPNSSPASTPIETVVVDMRETDKDHKITDF